MRTLFVAFLVVGCGAAATGRAVRSDREPTAATTAVPAHPHRRLAIGTGFGCALLSSGPTCWGTPPFDGADPASPALLGDAVELDASDIRLCARFRDGGVRCWDQDASTPGSGTLTAPPIPPAQRVWAARPCALSHDGELWCWNTARASFSFPEAADASFGRMQTVPFAIDMLSGPGLPLCALEASGRLALWDHGEIGASVVIEGARSLTPGSDGAEVLVQLDGDRVVRARFEDGVTLTPGPTAIDIAYPAEQMCVLDRTSHGACFHYGDASDPVPVELLGPRGMVAIAANQTQACVLTEGDEVYCFDIRLPPRIVELAASSTGLSEQGGIIWAEGAPWTGMLEHGGPVEWPTREEGCVGGHWTGFGGAPDPDALGWMLCGDVLSVSVEEQDSREVRVVSVPGVRRVSRARGGLTLSMRDRTTRIFFTDDGWGEYGTLGPPLEGFSRLRDFDEGVTHRCGVTARGVVRCRAADPNTSSTVFDVTGITNAREVETAHGCACARTASGGVQCVDLEAGGVGGPVRDAGLDDTRLNDIVELTANDEQICARSSDGHLWCASQRLTPIPATEQPTDTTRCGAFLATVLDDVAEIEAGPRALCARQSTGRVLCWGDTHDGIDARDVELRLSPDRTAVRVAP